MERAQLKALAGTRARVRRSEGLNDPATLKDADLLVLPYGSAVSEGAWKAIEGYLHTGGNLLVVGGQPLRVPVMEADGKFAGIAAPGHLFARARFRHTYEVPVPGDARFAWKFGYAFCADAAGQGAADSSPSRAGWTGWATWSTATGLVVAAPVIVSSQDLGSDDGQPHRGARFRS